MPHPTHYQHATLQFSDTFSLQVPTWTLQHQQHWVILGPNGAGKSALAASLLGEGELTQGERHNALQPRTQGVSFESQAALIEAERKKDDADILDVISTGTPAKEYLSTEAKSDHWAALRQVLDIESYWQRAFRALSTGETRKLLLLNALASDAQRLVLDEPYEGLDAKACQALEHTLTQQAKSRQLVLVLNRFSHIPAFTTHLAWVEQACLQLTLPISEQRQLEQLLHLTAQAPELPAPLPEATSSAKTAIKPLSLAAGEPLVTLKQAHVRYTDNLVFERLDWEILPQQHWQLIGPNGSGKTCLLNLITGDHPQCYQNDITLFGIKRGTGESIWQVKAHIGYVSSAVQWEYRVNVSAWRVIVSGLYDSIGVYQRIPEAHRALAREWLGVLGMTDRENTPFKSLSFGEQRLLLIARAMIKHPTLLILDEPCLGLDEINRRLVLALIEKICAEGQSTVLYVNHQVGDHIEGINHHYQLGDKTGRVTRAD